MAFTLTDIYYYLQTIFSSFGSFGTLMSTKLGDLTGSVVVQNSPIGNLSLLGVLLGGGLTFYVIRTLIRWVTNL